MTLGHHRAPIEYQNARLSSGHSSLMAAAEEVLVSPREVPGSKEHEGAGINIHTYMHTYDIQTYILISLSHSLSLSHT